MTQDQLKIVIGNSAYKNLLLLLRTHLIILVLALLGSYLSYIYGIVFLYLLTYYFLSIYIFVSLCFLVVKLIKAPSLNAKYKRVMGIIKEKNLAPRFFFDRIHLPKNGQYTIIDQKQNLILVQDYLAQLTNLKKVSYGYDNKKPFIQFVFSKGKQPVKRVYFRRGDGFISEYYRLSNFLNETCGWAQARS